MKLSICAAILALLAGIFLSGCSGGSGSSLTTPDGGKPVTFKTVGAPVMDLAHFQSIQRSDQFTLIANNVDTTIASYPVAALSVWQNGLSWNGTFTTSQQFKIGHGHSGSPLFDRSGQWVGALNAGNDGDPYSFYAISAADMLPLLDGVETEVRSTNAVKADWIYTGPSNGFDFLQKKMPGRVFSGGAMTAVSRVKRFASRGGTDLNFAPGSTIGIPVMLSNYGDMTAYGALTYSHDGIRYLGFGHPLEQMGACHLPVCLATVDQVVDVQLGVFKDCHLAGPPSGTLTGDHWNGVVANMSAPPAMGTISATVSHGDIALTPLTGQTAKIDGGYLERSAIESGIFAPLGYLDLTTGPVWAEVTLICQLDGSDAIPVTFNVTTGYNGNPIGDMSTLIYRIEDQVYSDITSSAVAGTSFINVSLNVVIHDGPPPAG